MGANSGEISFYQFETKRKNSSTKMLIPKYIISQARGPRLILPTPMAEERKCAAQVVKKVQTGVLGEFPT